jgi:hypothetical protein
LCDIAGKESPSISNKPFLLSTECVGRWPLASRGEGGYPAVKKRKVGLAMAEHDKKPVYVRVRDEAGNQFLCPIDALKDIKKATAEDLENCVDNAVAERYGGEIKVVEK